MPQKWVEPQVFMEYRGVKVYYLYKDNDWERPLDDMFTLSSDDNEHHPDMEFTMCELPTYDLPTEANHLVIRRAIDEGLLDAQIKSAGQELTPLITEDQLARILVDVIVEGIGYTFAGRVLSSDVHTFAKEGIPIPGVVLMDREGHKYFLTVSSRDTFKRMKGV